MKASEGPEKVYRSRGWSGERPLRRWGIKPAGDLQGYGALKKGRISSGIGRGECGSSIRKKTAGITAHCPGFPCGA